MLSISVNLKVIFCVCFIASAQEWNTGVTAAKSQNFARDLMETPANLMTPTIFAETVANELEKLNVKITIR